MFVCYQVFFKNDKLDISDIWYGYLMHPCLESHDFVLREGLLLSKGNLWNTEIKWKYKRVVYILNLLGGSLKLYLDSYAISNIWFKKIEQQRINDKLHINFYDCNYNIIFDGMEKF